MPTASERARELPPGPELDALFFETCWPNEPLPPALWYRYVDGEPVFQKYPHVTAAAAACDSWVMRWLNENGIRWQLQWCAATVDVPTGDDSDSMSGVRILTEEGETWKHALTRAAIAAKEAMKGERDE